MNGDLYRASHLAKYLIEEKGVKHKTAYCISAKKYKIEHWSIVSKEYQKIKRKQLKLI